MSDTYSQLDNVCFILEPSYHVSQMAKQGGGENSVANISAQAKQFDEQLEVTFKEVILPAIDGRGFRIIRSSSLYDREKITAQYVQQIKTAKLVIADISGDDPIVHYCLGYRHALLENICQNPEQGLFMVMDRRNRPKLLDLPDEAESLIYYGQNADINAIENGNDPQKIKDYIHQMNVRARQDLTAAVEKFLLLKTHWQQQAKGHVQGKSDNKDGDCKPDEGFIERLLDEQAYRFKCELLDAKDKPRNFRRVVSNMAKDLNISDENR